jgi:hypothetical protein
MMQFAEARAGCGARHIFSFVAVFAIAILRLPFTLFRRISFYARTLIATSPWPPQPALPFLA